METIIQTKDLTKAYGQMKALDALNLSVTPGEILGYLGPNGAGKTTTIRLILGLIKPTSGTVEIFGQNASHYSASELHKDMAYVAGETNLWPHLTGAETLRFLNNLHGHIDVTYQQELIKKFEFDPNKKVRNYSKGNRQKIALIAALSTRAELLIFDEPTSGLDPVMAKVFRDETLLAKQNGQTVFLSSHMLEEVEQLCDRVAVLRKGKLVELGTLEELRHLSAMTIEASFPAAPPDVTKIKGVSNVAVEGHKLHCHIQGEITPLLQVITKAKPTSFISRKPSLEELFLALYDGDDQ